MIEGLDRTCALPEVAMARRVAWNSDPAIW
jgi:hypothetical protein